MSLWSQNLAQRLRSESPHGRRRVCPLSTSTSLRSPAHGMGRNCVPSISLAPNFTSWASVPDVASAATSSRPASIPSPATQPPGHGLQDTLPFNEEEYVEVGHVVGAHGVRGDLRLELSTDQPAERFQAGRRLYLLPPSPAPRGQSMARNGPQEPPRLLAVTVRGAKTRPLGKGEEAWMVAMEEVTSRTQAEHLRGYTVLCTAADRGALRDPDEFYATDIIGCTVIHEATRRMVGVVVDVYGGTGTHDTLRVKLRANEEDILKSRIRYCMIPFAKAICPVLDLSSRTLEVSPPEGLLDLVTEEKLREPLSDETKAKKLAQLKTVQAREALLQPPPQQQQQQEEEDGEDGKEAEENPAEDAPAAAGKPDGAQRHGDGGGRGIARWRRLGLRQKFGSSMRLGRLRE